MIEKPKLDAHPLTALGAYHWALLKLTCKKAWWMAGQKIDNFLTDRMSVDTVFRN